MKLFRLSSLSLLGSILYFCFGASSVSAQTLSTPRVGINTATPNFTLDVNGKMRIANVPRHDKDYSYLLAIKKSSRQVVRTNASFKKSLRIIQKTYQIQNNQELYKVEIPTTEINPKTEVAVLLRADLIVSREGDHQRVVTFVDKPAGTHTLQPAMTIGVDGKVYGEPEAGANKPYISVLSSLGDDAQGLPIPNSLFITTKKTDFRLNATGDKYVLELDYGKASRLYVEGSWHVTFLVCGKLWMNEMEQVVRVRGRELKNLDNTPYTPFYTKQIYTDSRRPRPEPLDLSQTTLRGKGEAGATIFVTKYEGGVAQAPQTTTVTETGDWSIPTGALQVGTYFEVAQEEVTTTAHPLNRSAAVRVEARANGDDSRVGIATRTPQNTLDVRGTWAIHDTPEYHDEGALPLAVGNNLEEGVFKYNPQHRAIYTFNLALNNPQKDWVKWVTLRGLGARYQMVPTRTIFHGTTRKDGKLVSFDPDDPEKVAAFLTVWGPVVRHTTALKNGQFAFAEGSSEQFYDVGSGGTLRKDYLAALMFPNKAFRSTGVGLDYARVVPMAGYLPHSWRITYLGINLEWLKK